MQSLRKTSCVQTRVHDGFHPSLSSLYSKALVVASKLQVQLSYTNNYLFGYVKVQTSQQTILVQLPTLKVKKNLLMLPPTALSPLLILQGCCYCESTKKNKKKKAQLPSKSHYTLQESNLYSDNNYYEAVAILCD